jgi:hypothetical protein
LTLNPNGSFVYAPHTGYSGTDSFTYRASDGLLSSPPVAVSITIIPNFAPVAVPDAYTTAFNTPLNVAAPGVLANDADSDVGDMLSALLLSGPASGTLTLNANGSFGYTPNAGFAGTDSFTYRAYDGALASVPATVTLTVSQPTTVQPPTAFYAYSVVGNTVTFRWTRPALGPAVTGYVVEGGILPGQVLASLPTDTAAPILTIVAPTGSFHVRVHALAGAQRSDPSNEIRLHVNVPVTPSAPANFTGLVNGSTLNLSWRNTFEGGPPSSLLLDVTGSAAATLPLGAGNTFGFVGVPGGTYTLRLRAANAGGSSAQSPPITLTFPGPCSGPPEAPPDVLLYRVGSTAIALWEPSGSGPAATGFVLEVTGSFVGNFSTAGRTLNGQVGPGTYHIRVFANNACGTSAPSAMQTLVVP